MNIKEILILFYSNLAIRLLIALHYNPRVHFVRQINEHISIYELKLTQQK